MTMEAQVNEVFETLADRCEPHVASKIEPGAILYSSWGYDQTNIDFYMVTRTTAKSAWIVPMSSPITEEVGWLSENVVAGEPMTHTNVCECGHNIRGRHHTVYVVGGNDYTVCEDSYHSDYDKCECREIRPQAIKPEMHRIQTYREGGCLSLTSYSSAWLWEGRKLNATHYH